MQRATVLGVVCLADLAVPLGQLRGALVPRFGHRQDEVAQAYNFGHAVDHDRQQASAPEVQGPEESQQEKYTNFKIKVCLRVCRA